jgi:hypothetical protein
VASHSHSCEDDAQVLCGQQSQGYMGAPCHACFILAGTDTMVTYLWSLQFHKHGFTGATENKRQNLVS